jgi:hypothetical protein
MANAGRDVRVGELAVGDDVLLPFRHLGDKIRRGIVGSLDLGQDFVPKEIVRVSLTCDVVAWLQDDVMVRRFNR